MDSYITKYNHGDIPYYLKVVSIPPAALKGGNKLSLTVTHLRLYLPQDSFEGQMFR